MSLLLLLWFYRRCSCLFHFHFLHGNFQLVEFELFHLLVLHFLLGLHGGHLGARVMEAFIFEDLGVDFGRG